MTLQDKALDYGVGIGAIALGLIAKIYGIDGEFFALVAAVAGIMFGLGIRKA